MTSPRTPPQRRNPPRQPVPRRFAPEPTVRRPVRPASYTALPTTARPGLDGRGRQPGKVRQWPRTSITPEPPPASPGRSGAYSRAPDHSTMRSPTSRRRVRSVGRVKPIDIRLRGGRTTHSRSRPREIRLSLAAATFVAVMLAAMVGFSAVTRAVAVNTAAGHSFPATPARPSPAPTTPSSTPVVGKPPPATNPRVVEGRDYTYLAKVGNKPIHWSCDSTIEVTLVGHAPRGADRALQYVVPILAKASRLRLQIRRPVSSLANDQPGVIAVHYVSRGTTVEHVTITDRDTLGRGGPGWGSDGVITFGVVLVRNDSPEADPATPQGQQVLAHELAHALGLGHSEADTRELMAPASGAGATASLGRGDRVALAQVGCQ
jgi:hypothetical protein